MMRYYQRLLTRVVLFTFQKVRTVFLAYRLFMDRTQQEYWTPSLGYSRKHMRYCQGTTTENRSRNYISRKNIRSISLTEDWKQDFRTLHHIRYWCRSFTDRTQVVHLVA